jgi:NhaA family Na+:H+ antiporter
MLGSRIPVDLRVFPTAAVVIDDLVAAIVLGLVAGKPVGMVLVAAIAVDIGLATKPAAYTSRQMVVASALAGIGFTMSLFIAGCAFADESDFTAAKIGIFFASLIACTLGAALLWKGGGNAANNTVT